MKGQKMLTVLVFLIAAAAAVSYLFRRKAEARSSYADTVYATQEPPKEYGIGEQAPTGPDFLTQITAGLSSLGTQLTSGVSSLFGMKPAVTREEPRRWIGYGLPASDAATYNRAKNTQVTEDAFKAVYESRKANLWDQANARKLNQQYGIKLYSDYDGNLYNTAKEAADAIRAKRAKPTSASQTNPAQVLRSRRVITHAPSNLSAAEKAAKHAAGERQRDAIKRNLERAGASKATVKTTQNAYAAARYAFSTLGIKLPD